MRRKTRATLATEEQSRARDVGVGVGVRRREYVVWLFLSFFLSAEESLSVLSRNALKSIAY